jgi:hypothetical protein
MIVSLAINSLYYILSINHEAGLLSRRRVANLLAIAVMGMTQLYDEGRIITPHHTHRYNEKRMHDDDNKA